MCEDSRFMHNKFYGVFMWRLRWVKRSTVKYAKYQKCPEICFRSFDDIDKNQILLVPDKQKMFFRNFEHESFQLHLTILNFYVDARK